MCVAFVNQAARLLRLRAIAATVSSSPNNPRVPLPVELPGELAVQATPLPDATSRLHTLSKQSWLWHCAPLEQVAPVGNSGAQTLPLVQYSLEVQSASVVQAAPVQR
jgi:hypothetical protein